jgi:predicted nucleic acid-binding protein
LTIAPLLVVDASVVLKWVLDEPGRSSSLLLLDAFEARETNLLAPDSLMHEVGSVLSRRCRRKLLSVTQAKAAFALLDHRKPLLFGGSVLMTEALTLSVRHSLSYWDGLYVTLALRNDCPLVTADRRLYRAAAHHFPFVELLGE